MAKVNNPFKPSTVAWKLLEDDWSDLTVRQIAEVLDVQPDTVHRAIRAIRKETGYEVPHKVGERSEVKVMKTTAKGHLE